MRPPNPFTGATCLLLLLAIPRTMSTTTFTPARPPAVPLAVRSPYLNVWLQASDTTPAGPTLPGSWPRFWTGQTQGWQGLVAVDGQAYAWMGASDLPLVNQTRVEYTATRSVFTFDVAGKVEMEVTFLSPVFAADLVRQSQQMAYVGVKVRGGGGAEGHAVQVYMDVTGEFASGDVGEVVKWDTGRYEEMAFHRFQKEEERVFREEGEIASWGTWYLTTGYDEDLTWQIGHNSVVRGQFASNGALNNTKEEDFRPVKERWPVFAFSHDLGNVQNDEVERVFTLGLVQRQLINFAGLSGKLEPVPSLLEHYYKDEISSVNAFSKDYRHACDVSDDLDNQIHIDSVKAGGSDYSLITTLALRQTFGGLQFAGTPEKPYIFLKEISSNSDIQTVDVIFPAFPIFMYLNATLSKYLLDPIFENQESGAYPNAWAEHDLGTFPVAKGYPAGDDESMPLEECGNMIIMTLAYVQRTGDIDYIKAHYPKLMQWAQFLIDDSLIPSHQLSTDDFAGPLVNQTNLAIKGIIGLRAMGEMAKLSGNEDQFSAVAENYLQEWKRLAINRDAEFPHTTLSYGDKDSHGILYNIYADRLLSLDFIPQDVYDMQSAFYPTVAREYAVPLDTRHAWAKSDWAMFAAAVASPETRDMFVGKLARWIGDTTAHRAMTDLFDADTGGFPAEGPTFVARPVAGGLFALLGLPGGK